MFFGSSHFPALFVFLLNDSEIPRLSQKLEALAFDAVKGERAFI